LKKQDLLQRLAEGHAARITVITPNARLAQALTADFDDHQIGKNLSVWEAADILPFQAFVGRLYEDALYADMETDLPLLLTPAQEQWLWEQAVRAAPREVLSAPATAAQCRDAWRLLHAWRIEQRPGNEDVAAFNQWSAAYREASAGQADAARLPDLVSTLLSHLRKPKLLVAYGFDIPKPQEQAFLKACEAQGVEIAECAPPGTDAVPVRTAFPSAKNELEAAAAWARARLENRGQAPISAKIGIVVPDLQQRRNEVVRVFSRVLQPGFNLPGAAKAPMPFNVSLGLPLARYPVVALALNLLRFSQESIPFEDASRLIRSPFLGGAELELAARAKLDVRLRRKLEATVSLPKLIGLLDESVLREKLEALFPIAKEKQGKQQGASEWARHFSALLDAAGFPGERALDSNEFQTRAKWHEVLGELARLERVSSKLAFHHAFSTLKRLCEDTVFQPESGDAPIQVLGILESAGLEFDHLWVSGLTDDAWPLRARPNPFVPVALQKQAGIPEASAEGSLALDRRITAQWMRAAGEVVFSSYETDQDRELAPSPLIAGIPRGAVEVPAFPHYKRTIHSGRKTESLEDRLAPPVRAPRARGGTRVLADQAACPFRAFARWRLGAEALEAPAEGLDAAARGVLLHAFMKHLWSLLKDSSALQHPTENAIEKAAEAATRDLQLEGRFAELECARLARLAREWLELEKERPPFSVASLEEKRDIQIGALELSGRIDRMDRLHDGSYALFDYKTGQVSRQGWLGQRPEEPQLPIYAVSAKEEVSTLAFARLQRGKLGFSGYARSRDLVPKVEAAKDWKALLRMWKQQIAALGEGFAAGEARVDPKRGLATCRYCDLHTLCRVYEKVSALSDDSSAENE
jgi:ATP-dependent helicase/nuclease subunit B